jgi:hypothetical protein
VERRTLQTGSDPRRSRYRFRSGAESRHVGALRSRKQRGFCQRHGAKFPGYTFQITEGQETQEILVGVRASLSAFFTQKLEFKSGTTSMRPGLLATVTVASKSYCVLFLHLASSNEPRGFGLRDDMAIRAIKFRKTLDAAAGGKANYLFLGDLNTMGLDYPYQKAIDPLRSSRSGTFAPLNFTICAVSSKLMTLLGPTAPARRYPIVVSITFMLRII